MKLPLKIRIFTILIAVTFVGIALSTSCNTDKCKTIVCANGSYCQLGTCICPIGYEGTSCEIRMRDKFLGTWVVFEKGSGTFGYQYPVSIDTIGTKLLTQVRLLNFNDSFKSAVYATVNGYNINIQNQQLDGKTTFGQGYIYIAPGVNYNQYNTMNMQYEVIDSATLFVNDYGYNPSVDGSTPSTWNKQ